MTFYLKYRPQKIDELDLKNVRESLAKIVGSGKIPHALLFSGPKGTGKTSAARILAKVVNCLSADRQAQKKIEPCNRCEQCKAIARGTNIDVIELDAASHRGIDDVRALRDAVKLTPAKARKKVYIIDEAHMLTTEACNALLKTLEEPPEHVIFILATTNPEKLVETIRSRTTDIFFQKAKTEEITRSLKRVIKGEKLKADKETLEQIAEASSGSFRDAVKILEQLVSEGKSLKKEEIEKSLFGKRGFQPESLFKHLAKKDVVKALEEIERVVETGVPMMNYLESILKRLRKALLEKVGIEAEAIDSFSKEEIINLIELFSQSANELKGAAIEQLPVEMAVIKWCEKNSEIESSVPPKNTGNGDLKHSKKINGDGKNFIPPMTDEAWSRVLAGVRVINTSIEALLRATKPISLDGDVLTLGVYYRFHKERLEDPSHRKILEEVIAGVLGAPIKVMCILTSPPPKKIVEEAKQEVALTQAEDEDIIKVAKEIFGS